MTRLRVLLLDDDPARHAWVDNLHSGKEVVGVYRFNEAVKLLQEEHWDILHLDHDLADLIKDADGDNQRVFDGRDMARWLVANPQFCPLIIWIHSWSDYADDMAKILGSLTGVSVKVKQAPDLMEHNG